MKKIIAWANPDYDYCRRQRHAALLVFPGIVVEFSGFMLASDLRAFKPWNSLVAAITTVVTAQLCWPMVKFGWHDKGHP